MNIGAPIMTDQIFIGIPLLCSIWLTKQHFVFYRSFKSLHTQAEMTESGQMNQLDLYWKINSNKAKGLGMLIVTTSLLLLFIGSFYMDKFSLVNYFHEYDLSASLYIPAMIFATVVCMIVNSIQINKFKKEATNLSGQKFVDVVNKIHPKERIFNGLFVLFTICLSAQFLFFGMQF